MRGFSARQRSNAATEPLSCQWHSGFAPISARSASVSWRSLTAAG